MASATFGRKGAANAVAQPGVRRAAFGRAGAAAVTAPADPAADRRAAFLASERARAADASGEDMDGASRGETRTAVFIKERSLTTAYVLWFFLGGFSAHRFYLGTPLTAIAQVCLWYISLMFFMAGNAAAFYPMALGLIWIFGDSLLIPQMRNAANARARRRAEGLVLEPVAPAEPVSS
ncbi:MAG: TM2 domain-containing protein [Sphingomonas sp.]